MIAYGLIVLNAAVALFALLDILLSDKQKERLANWTVRLWVWLDEMKKTSLLSWLRNSKRRILGAALLLGGCYVILVVMNRIPGYENDKSIVAWSFYGLSLLVSVWIGLKIITVTLNARTLLGSFLRATLFVCLVVTPLVGIVILATYFREVLTPHETPTLFQLLFVIVFITTILFTALILIFWAVIATPLAFAYTLTVVLYVMEFTVRRLAEYPKGPILAASLLFGGVVLLVKAFA